jgi:DNA-binding PadR family transcriptional regulator
VSPVFRHGRLRLYLLKLLDEAPRHGYEVIRLLQDRFLGVYAPSPGTIYPRLARLEEEGLVTHDEADGRKVYRITDKGREELRARYDDLAELEEEITASVRDIAQEVSEDVRATVRSLREELTSAARGMGGSTRDTRRAPGEPWHEASSERDQARQEAQAERDRAQAERDRARAQRDQAKARRSESRAQHGEAAGAGPRPGAGGEQDETREQGEAGWGWGMHGWGDWSDWVDWRGRRSQTGHTWADPGAYRDMEKLARQFTREFHRAAGQAQAVGEEAVASLRDILEDALDRIRTEVFGAGQGHPRPDAGSRGSSAPGGPAPGGPAPGGPASAGPASGSPASGSPASGSPSSGSPGPASSGSGPASDSGEPGEPGAGGEPGEGPAAPPR